LFQLLILYFTAIPDEEIWEEFIPTDLDGDAEISYNPLTGPYPSSTPGEYYSRAPQSPSQRSDSQAPPPIVPLISQTRERLLLSLSDLGSLSASEHLDNELSEPDSQFQDWVNSRNRANGYRQNNKDWHFSNIANSANWRYELARQINETPDETMLAGVGT